MSLAIITTIVKVLGVFMLLAGIGLTVSGAVTKKRGLWIPGIVLISAGLLSIVSPAIANVISRIVK